jgi:hypothetical protein
LLSLGILTDARLSDLCPLWAYRVIRQRFVSSISPGHDRVLTLAGARLPRGEDVNLRDINVRDPAMGADGRMLAAIRENKSLINTPFTYGQDVVSMTHVASDA